jgi:hypothetical protein
MKKKRELKLKAQENDKVTSALRTLSGKENVMERAATPREMDNAQVARRKTRKVLRDFENSKQRHKDLHTGSGTSKHSPKPVLYIRDHGLATKDMSSTTLALPLPSPALAKRPTTRSIACSRSLQISHSPRSCHISH